MRISDWSSDVCSSDLLLSIFYIVDGAYFAANMTKMPDGGWFPLLVGLVIFTLLTTWAKGRQLMLDRMREAAMPIPVFVASAANSAVRVPGTAVFMTSTPARIGRAPGRDKEGRSG